MPRAREMTSRASRSKRHNFIRLFSRIALSAALLCSRRTARADGPTPAPATAPAVVDVLPEQQTIQPEILAQMYQGELGAAYRATDVQKLLAAHALIESYFAAANS